MTAPRKSSIAAVAIAAALIAGVVAIRSFFPPNRIVEGSRLSSLSAEQAQLAKYSDGSAREEDARLAGLRRQFWTSQSFDRWRRAYVPTGWFVEDLGRSGQQRVLGRRYAFQRPNATDTEWPEITALLRELESVPCVSVQSAAFAVQPSYAGSRQFSQCLLVAVFYFAGDGGPAPSPSP